MNPESSSGGGGSEARYKGVRQRKWGKWVSEVRLPNSRERIWLGSYDSPEKAARAFDAAAFCLRGNKAQLNFPDMPPPIQQSPRSSLTHQQIQEVASRHAYSTRPASYASGDHRGTGVPTELSDEFLVAAMDWSFLDLDLMAVPTTDFCYNFIPAETSTEHEEGESCSSLWSF